MHSSRKVTLILLSTLLPLSGCDRIHQLLNANDIIKKQGKQIATLQSNVSSLTQELKQLKKEQNQLEVSNFVNSMQQMAYLTPGQSGYSLVRSDLGILTVQLSNIRPYANGSKVSLKFGNLLAANINGLTFTLNWGQVNDKGIPDMASAKQKKFTFPKPLLSGSWTTIPIVLEGVPPNKLGFVRVENVTHTGVSLAP